MKKIILGGLWIEDLERIVREYPNYNIEFGESADGYHYEATLTPARGKPQLKLEACIAKELLHNQKELFDKLVEKYRIISFF